MLFKVPDPLTELFEAEFACWFSASKVTNNQQGKMPQELPTSHSVPMSPQSSHISTQPSTTPVSSVNTMVISKDKVLTSICDSIISSSMSHSSAPHHSKTIDLIVVPTGGASTSVVTSTTTTMSTGQYNLSEIVSREKDILFKPGAGTDVELEPARHDVFSVRRRSRQFFTVTEEEENDSEAESHINPADLFDEKEKTVDVQPIFNLGDSLKKLYFPQKHRTQKRKRGKKHGHHVKHHTHGYESDPEGTIALTDIIKNDPELKQYKSHPDLYWTDNVLPHIEDTVAVRSSKSLPNTPRVSPKLMRKNSINSNQGEIEKSGPGFSFLASVAGSLHQKKAHRSKNFEKSVVAVSKSSVVQTQSAPVEVLNQSSTVTCVSYNQEPSTDIHTHHVHDFSDSTGADLESHKPAFISTFMDWGTKKKVRMTNKESNMFSPTSF